MSLIDEIAAKRADNLDAKKAVGAHSDSLVAINRNGDATVAAIQNVASKDDIGNLLAEFKQFGGHLINGFGAISDSFDKQPDIPQLLSDMHTSLSEAIKQLDSSEHDNQQLTILNEIKDSLQKLSQVEAPKPIDYSSSNKELLKAVKAIKVSPVVNVPKAVITVPEPKVTIQEKELDFKPLQDTLEQLMATPEDTPIDLDCYKAQDINDGKKFQYIGFLNPNGNWYIIENDVKGNSLRYVFGSGEYEKAFSEAATYQYMLLNEAIHALST